LCKSSRIGVSRVNATHCPRLGTVLPILATMHTHPPSKEVKRLSNLLSWEGEAFADFLVWLELEHLVDPPQHGFCEGLHTINGDGVF
jgi:hypothetical protein